MKHHISYFYNALLEYYPLHKAWCETQSSSSTEKKVTRYVQNVHHWHEHKHTCVLAIGQLRHQSATAPISLATHAADALSQLINVMNVTVTSYLHHMQNK